jgi:hypothetical protein
MRYKGLIAAFALLLDARIAACEPMRFELHGTGGNCNGCDWLAADGEITIDTADHLLAYLQKEKLLDWRGSVLLNSPGGNLIGGIKLGEAIRKQGLSTEIGRSVPDGALDWTHQRTKGACVSACAFAFLGGVSRSASESANEGGKIGIHQFYNEAAIINPSAKVFNAIDFSAQQLLSALLIDYVMHMGVDPRLVVMASSISPTEVHYLSQEEAEELKVSWEPHKFEPWAIEPYGNGVVAYAKTRDRQTTVTLFCRRDKTPRVLVTFPVITDANNTLSLFGSLADVKAFDVTATKDKMTMNIKSGLAYWEINLAGSNLDSLARSAGIEPAEYVHVLWDNFVFQLPSTNLKQSARIALRNCT